MLKYLTPNCPEIRFFVILYAISGGLLEVMATSYSSLTLLLLVSHIELGNKEMRVFILSLLLTLIE